MEPNQNKALWRAPRFLLLAAACTVAACSGNANGTSTPPVIPDVPAQSPATAATQSPGISSQSPGTTSQSLIYTNGTTTTVTGSIVGVRTGSFEIQGGKGVGYLWIYTNSSTAFTGAKPYVGENVKVTGSGTVSTKITATSVAQLTSGTPAPAASPAPTATPSSGTGSTGTTGTVSSTNVARYQGCPVFTAGDYYNAPITSAAVDPNSANYINASTAAGNTGTFYAATGYEKVNLANNSTPLLTVHPKVSWHSFPTPYPWTSGYYIEPLSDGHSMVVQTQSCRVYEAFETSYSGGVLSAYSGVTWDLTKPFVPLAPGNPSSMASGLSMFAGMVKWEDYTSGAINHALNWAPPEYTTAAWHFVRPASDTDGHPFNGSSSYQLPYGAHLRLKAGVSTAGWGPEAAMVAKAMKTYGIYLADTGTGHNDALYFGNTSTGSNPWNYSDLSALSKLHLTDFEVIKLPTIQTDPGH